MSLRCWHCARDIPSQSSPDLVPLRLSQDAEGRWHFSGPGYFHNGHCLRAWVHDHLHGIEMYQQKQLWVNMRIYMREVHGLDRLPPPALPKECLEEFGGLYSWDEWMLACSAKESVDAWRIEEDLRFRPPIHHLYLPPVFERPEVTPLHMPKHLPGETNVLDHFICRLQKGQKN